VWWADEPEYRRVRFEIPGLVLEDVLGGGNAVNLHQSVNLCRRERARIEKACRRALAERPGDRILLEPRDFRLGRRGNKHCPTLASSVVPLIVFKEDFAWVEATPGIEPGCADLQSAASPLRHVAPCGAEHVSWAVPGWQWPPCGRARPSPPDAAPR